MERIRMNANKTEGIRMDGIRMDGIGPEGIRSDGNQEEKKKKIFVKKFVLDKSLVKAVVTKERRIITEELIEDYAKSLHTDEKSQSTIEKYVRDLRKLMTFAAGRELTKNLLIDYKEKLYRKDRYKVASVNSFLVAANGFFLFKEWYDLKIRTYRVQHESFCPGEKFLTEKDYRKLLDAAKEEKKPRIYMILQTLAATGMRASEIRYVTVGAVSRGVVEIDNKKKIRRILLPQALQKSLLYYIRKEKISRGPVFLTRNGRPVDRTAVWREMKKLCGEAGVTAEKVFPHNLRHLFAQTFYRIKKDLAELADILGHSSIETTRIYLRKSVDVHRRQLEKMRLVDDGWIAT